MLSFGTGDFFDEVVKQQRITQKRLWESVGKVDDPQNPPAQPPQDPHVKGPYEALLEYRDLVLSLR